jgi:hypothetical protein
MPFNDLLRGRRQENQVRKIGEGSLLSGRDKKEKRNDISKRIYRSLKMEVGYSMPGDGRRDS